MQIGQLLALEYLVGVALPDKTRQTAVALKALYDEDIVDEVRIVVAHRTSLALSEPIFPCTASHGQAALSLTHITGGSLLTCSWSGRPQSSQCCMWFAPQRRLCHLQGCIQYWHEKEGAAKVLGVPADAALAVRIAAKPFVDWLAEASDEEDDEDSDEE